jgi:cyclophilin family peptidyl-prolyl cis-trans isomerase
VTSEAIQALGEIDTPAAKARVNDALKSSILSEREAAASVVSTRKDADRFAMLYACYEDSLADPKWWDLRGGLLGEFVKENSSETTAYLHAALADPVPTIAYSAYGELSKRGDRSLPKMSAPELPRTVDSLLVFAKNPRLHVETTQGEFTIELFPQYAQIHVATIVGFALKGGYDGLPWHRVVSDFVVQGGDPDKTGYGSGPYPIRAEINPLHYQRGSVGMPRSSEWDSGGFQMFITHVPTPNLDGLYTIFGQVTHGMDVVDQLEPGDVMTKVSVDWVD